MKHKYILEGIVVRKIYRARTVFGLVHHDYSGLPDEWRFESKVEKKENEDNAWIEDYKLPNYSIAVIYQKEKFDKIYEGEIENPSFQVGETIRITDTQEEYKISRVARDTERNYIYGTNTITEVIHDGESEESKEKSIGYLDCKKNRDESSGIDKKKNWFDKLFR